MRYMAKAVKTGSSNFYFSSTAILEHAKFDIPNDVSRKLSTNEERGIIHCIILKNN